VADGSEWTVVTWPFQPAAALLVPGRVNNCWTTGARRHLQPRKKEKEFT